MHSSTVPVLLVTAMPLAACGDTPLNPPVRDAGASLQTDALEYELRSTEYGLEVEIPFTYTNGTGETVYVVNCQEIVPPSLDKRVDGQWVHAWSAVVPLCLSPPIVIWAGQTYTDTLRVFAGDPSNNMHPAFAIDEVAGTYRLVWHDVVHDYAEDRQNFGDPLPLEERVSNPFLLEK